MNKTNEEIFDLVQKLEAILTLLDQRGYALPAIKIEEALLALRQLEEESKD